MSLTPEQAFAGFLVVASLAEAYLIGAIPWALIVGRKVYGIDLRQEGSGNLGATNVFRVLGPKAAIAVAALDIAKGAFAVGLAWLLVPPTPYPVLHDWVLVGATLAAMLGHSYSPYIKLRGGKSIAVAAGGLLILTPKAWPILLITFIVIIALTHYVSVASITMAIEYPLLVLWLYGDQTPIVIFSFAAAAMVLWRHRSNMARLARGEEPRVDFRNAGQRAREMAHRARVDGDAHGDAMNGKESQGRDSGE